MWWIQVTDQRKKGETKRKTKTQNKSLKENELYFHNCWIQVPSTGEVSISGDKQYLSNKNTYVSYCGYSWVSWLSWHSWLLWVSWLSWLSWISWLSWLSWLSFICRQLGKTFVYNFCHKESSFNSVDKQKVSKSLFVVIWRKLL